MTITKKIETLSKKEAEAHELEIACPKCGRLNNFNSSVFWGIYAGAFCTTEDCDTAFELIEKDGDHFQVNAILH